VSDRPLGPDDPGEEPDEKPATGGPETGESGGFGLTDEFDRIEAEIEAEMETGGSAASEDEPEPEDPVERPADDGAPEGNDFLGTPPDTLSTADLGEDGHPEDEASGVEEIEPAPDEDEAEDGEPADEASDEAEADPEPETEVASVPEEQTASEHPLITPMPRPRPIAAAAAISDEDLEEKTPRLWLSFLVGSILIALSMATATAAFGLIFASDVVQQLKDNKIKVPERELAFTEGGAPQTILLIGSDKRSSNPESGARSDTTMLVRVDPDKDHLSMFSLPRDLVVEIPGFGTGPLNSAFSMGNATLTLKTVKELTGLEINHVAKIDFEGFGEAVNAIDCVYIDVDRDYFNDNSGLDQYAVIDLNPGYQRLCGQDALDYVRYRHTDTDIVRAARQQDFLREARQKVPIREVASPFGENEFIEIFTSYTESDIDSTGELIGILKSFLGAVDADVTEVHFEGDIGDATNTEVTATDEQIQAAVDQFLGNEGSSGPRGGANALDEDDAAEAPDNKKAKKKGRGKKDEPNEPELTVVAGDPLFERFATTVERRRENLSSFYPSVMAANSVYLDESREYDICVEGPIEGDCDVTEAAYKLVIQLNSDFLPEYYGVMGTTWDDPPILRNPSETREIDGREYKLFYDGDRLRLVGFEFEGASYWVNNTLTQAISESDMLEIATTMNQAHYKKKK